MMFFIVVGILVVGLLALAWLLWPSTPSYHRASSQDLHDQLVEIDAEILDLFDERADVVQALRKSTHVGRA